MKLKISDLAIEDIKLFLKNSKKSPNNLKKYYLSLISSINLLRYHPKLGKIAYIMKNQKIRKLIHKEHQILYLIREDEIIILSVVHTNYSIYLNLNFIQKYISEL